MGKKKLSSVSSESESTEDKTETIDIESSEELLSEKNLNDCSIETIQSTSGKFSRALSMIQNKLKNDEGYIEFTISFSSVLV